VLNIGYIELASGSGVVVRIYYDATATPVGPTQPLVNGPRGYCLDLTNTSGSNATVTLTSPSGTASTYLVGQGDPVASGPSKSLAANQMAKNGFHTRGDVTGFTLS
jgi:hypothetical protein